MADVLVEESSLQAIAEAIRSKSGGNEHFTPAQMGPAVAALQTGAEAVLGAKTITRNGTYWAEDDGLDGYSSVEVSRVTYLTPELCDGTGAYVLDGQFVPSSGTVERYDIYTVEAGHIYRVALGNTVGTRFRVLFTEEDPTEATEAMDGTVLYSASNPASNVAVARWTAPEDGYLTVYKDDASTDGLKSYLFDVTPPE